MAEATKTRDLPEAERARARAVLRTERRIARVGENGQNAYWEWRFRNDPIDPAWRARAERSLRPRVDGALGSGTLEAFECRGQHCRVQVSGEGGGQYANAMMTGVMPRWVDEEARALFGSVNNIGLTQLGNGRIRLVVLVHRVGVEMRPMIPWDEAEPVSNAKR